MERGEQDTTVVALIELGQEELQVDQGRDSARFFSVHGGTQHLCG